MLAICIFMGDDNDERVDGDSQQAKDHRIFNDGTQFTRKYFAYLLPFNNAIIYIFIKINKFFIYFLITSTA